MRIRKKWDGSVPNSSDGRRFSLRFPDSTKIECTIDAATPKVYWHTVILYSKHLYA